MGSQKREEMIKLVYGEGCKDDRRLLLVADDRGLAISGHTLCDRFQNSRWTQFVVDCRT